MAMNNNYNCQRTTVLLDHCLIISCLSNDREHFQSIKLKMIELKTEANYIETLKE